MLRSSMHRIITHPMLHAAFLACIFLASMAPTPSWAQAKSSHSDHPLVTRYKESKLIDSKVAAFDKYKFVTAVNAQGDLRGGTVEGKVTRIVYQNPPGRSTLEIFENYRKALVGSGMETVFTCAIETCGPSYARSAWNRYNGLFAAADGDPRYLWGKIITENGTSHIGLMVGRKRTQLDVIEVAPMEEGMVLVDARAMAKGIDKDGKISLYGIFFETDNAGITTDSKPALDEIAKLLKQRPALKLFVVGHTDMAGSLEHNRALSEARAKSVVAALVKDYGIDAERLEGHGVGPLAPVASNASEKGKASNRRVELVAR